MMNKKNTTNKSIHVGHNITRFRHLRGLKQETLAEMVGVTQQTMSHHEQQKIVSPDILRRIAKALNAPEDVLQNLEDDNTGFIIENSVSAEHDNAGIDNYIEQDRQDIRNPMNKIIELMERLLEHEQQRSEKLEEQLRRLEELIKHPSQRRWIFKLDQKRSDEKEEISKI